PFLLLFFLIHLLFQQTHLSTGSINGDESIEFRFLLIIKHVRSIIARSPRLIYDIVAIIEVKVGERNRERRI
ncbi:hypothetical protein PENTCL1PPCAC_11005, partial [Pristionchus entomophagus]